MSLGKVFNSFGCGDQIMEVHDRDAVCHFTLVHARNLEFRLIHENSPNMASMIHLRGQPRLNNNYTTWREMAVHRLERLVQPSGRFDIANPTDQPPDDIAHIPNPNTHHLTISNHDPCIPF